MLHRLASLWRHCGRVTFHESGAALWLMTTSCTGERSVGRQCATT